VAAHEAASNRMADIENLTEKELDHLHKFINGYPTWQKKSTISPARTQSMRLKITTR
jgi:hypothetical protein